MTENTEVTNTAELNILSDFLHDSDMDIDTLDFDRSEATISVVFEKELWDDRVRLGGLIILKFSVPVQKFVLTISNVTGYELNDTEKIGCYDLGELVLDPAGKRVEFTTGVPLDFAVNVSALKMRLDKLSDTPEWVNRRRLRFLD
jgi:hypothetical protein